VVRDISDQIITNAKKLGIDAIISIGGDGSQKIGHELFLKGMKIVGVPKTIDNDLSATEFTFGFDTALHTVTDAIDKIHTTASSHHRVMVVEVMGRDCGWIALASGIAGGAHLILIPEIPFTMKGVCDLIAQRENRGGRFTIVVVAEGIKLPPELKQLTNSGPVGNLVGNAIALLSNKEVRVSVLGHIQRGGSPSPFDRVLATRFGVSAVELIAKGQFGKMVALQAGSVVAVDVAQAIGRLKTVRPDGELVRTARAIGIGFGEDCKASVRDEPRSILADAAANGG
jgi:6-phosphofructokinase